MFITGIIMPFFMAVLLIKWQARLKEHWYEKTVGALYEDIRVHKRSALLYNVVFVSRRMFFSAIIFVA